jgi:hypothetical protein
MIPGLPAEEVKGCNRAREDVKLTKAVLDALKPSLDGQPRRTRESGQGNAISSLPPEPQAGRVPRPDRSCKIRPFMSRACLLLSSLLPAMVAVVPAAELTLTAPLPHEVVQRSSPGKGLLRITGELSEEVSGKDLAIEARLVGEKEATGWQRAGGSIVGKKLSGTVEAPSGGWWSLEVRVTREGKELAAGRVGKVGVGEVFVVAGQSNSANHLVLPKTRRFAMSGSPCSITLG